MITDKFLKVTGMYDNIKTSLEHDIRGDIVVQYNEQDDTLYICICPDALPKYFTISVHNFDRMVINGTRLSYLKDMILAEYQQKLNRLFFKNT